MDADPLDVQAEPTTPSKVQPHPSQHSALPAEKETYFLMHPVYSKDYVLSIKPKHRKPQTFHDYTGYYAVQALRRSFDLLTGYNTEKMTSDKWLTRFLFLETVAGVPGMVAAALRHMRSLRTMKRDGGWIHTLLEEAENERMHLLTFMNMRQPGLVFRSAVLATQGVFLSLYTFFYALSPKHCHAFVSYLEEEAVKTYTHAIHDLDSGRIPEWKDLKAPPLALKYWRLEEGATMRDVLLAVRADEVSVNNISIHACMNAFTMQGDA